jgi:hypothetical protein
MADKQQPPDDWEPEEQFAQRIGKTRRTLRLWRELRIGPPYSKVGNTILYSHSAWLAYLKSNEVRPARSA